MSSADFSAERMAEHFVNYMFERYKGHARHVHRVAGWLGFLALGIDQIKDNWHGSNSRQLIFEKDGRKYKVRYSHDVEPNGGIEIVEVASGRGSPDGAVVVQITSLYDAERFYKNPRLGKPAGEKKAA
jgi:hypothetical protein